MKRSLVILGLCLLGTITGQPQSRNGTSATARDRTIVDIRQIDFRNFAYVVSSKSYKLRDGYYAEVGADGFQWELGMVDGPYYGDLTGDGKDEVAFVLSYGRAQAPSTAEARVYTLQGGRLIQISNFPVTDSLSCRLDHYLNIEDGMIGVERVYAKDSRCDRIEVTQYRWDGTQFAAIGGLRRLPCRCM